MQLLSTDTTNASLHPTNTVADLNPVDYKVWAVMQEKVYNTKIANVYELCDRIVNAWEELDQRVINAAVRQWRSRLYALVCLLGVDAFNIFCD